MSICVSKEKTMEWKGSRLFLPILKRKKKGLIKYLDNKRKLVEIELLEVLRTVEAISTSK